MKINLHFEKKESVQRKDNEKREEFVKEKSEKIRKENMYLQNKKEKTLKGNGLEKRRI